MVLKISRRDTGDTTSVRFIPLKYLVLRETVSPVHLRSGVPSILRGTWYTERSLRSRSSVRAVKSSTTLVVYQG